MAFLDNVKRRVNAFLGNETGAYVPEPTGIGASYGSRPDRMVMHATNERSIIASILTRISIDVASIDIRHVGLDDKGRYKDEVDSGLNRCLSFEANLDQSPRAFRQDIALTMLDSDQACIVPVDKVRDPETGKTEILTVRVGRVVAWYPKHVKVSVYNEATARRQEIIIEKTKVALPDNPLYTVMNGQNSTLNRLIRKLNLLDVVDEQSSSGKLDLIIQLPYTIRSDVKRQQAETRRAEIEKQMTGSKYGIAFADATEKIVQLNRPAENNLLAQIQFLTKMLYGQLGLTEEIMDGTADEKAMLNYLNRTIEPILTSITEAMMRSFVGYQGLLDNERVRYYMNPFKLVPLSQLADIIDKLNRNEIMDANEIRDKFLGLPPHSDPKADQLMNSNINPSGMSLSADGTPVPNPPVPVEEALTDQAQPAQTEDGEALSIVNAAFDSLEADIEKTFEDLGSP